MVLIDRNADHTGQMRLTLRSSILISLYKKANHSLSSFLAIFNDGSTIFPTSSPGLGRTVLSDSRPERETEFSLPSAFGASQTLVQHQVSPNEKPRVAEHCVSAVLAFDG